MSELQWYEGPGTPPVDVWWWAVEHLGHPAFYLRALMPGDFAPGEAGPRPRHVLSLEGELVDVVTCGTCEQQPHPDDLEPYERQTALGGWLDLQRRGRVRWSRPTDESACWECSNKREPGRVQHQIEPGRQVTVCNRCNRALVARGRDGRDKLRRGRAVARGRT